MNFSEAFFEVTAQLIPVLFLAMVVEDRFQRPSEETAGDRVLRSWVLALLVLGEVLCLSVVAGGLSPSKGTGSVVSSTLLVSALLLAVPVLGGELKRGRSRFERLGHGSAALFIVSSVLVTLVLQIT